MLTPTERHIAQGLQAQLADLEHISQERDDAEWRRLWTQAQVRMRELQTEDPELYTLLSTEIPLTPHGIRLCEKQAALDRLRGIR